MCHSEHENHTWHSRVFLSWEVCRRDDNRFLCQGSLTGLICWVTPHQDPPQISSLELFRFPRKDSSRFLPESDNNPCIAKPRVLLVQSLQKENHQSSARVREKQSGCFTTSYENFPLILFPCCFFFMRFCRVLQDGCSCSQISSPASFSGCFLFLLSVLPPSMYFTTFKISFLLTPVLFIL